MSLQAVIALAIYIAVVALVGFLLIWTTRYLPGDLQTPVKAFVVVICILLVLLRLAGFV